MIPVLGQKVDVQTMGGFNPLVPFVREGEINSIMDNGLLLIEVYNGLYLICHKDVRIPGRRDPLYISLFTASPMPFNIVREVLWNLKDDTIVHTPQPTQNTTEHEHF